MYKRKIGIVGFGNLGSALHQGFTQAGIVTRVNNGSMERTERKLKEQGSALSYAATLDKIARECQIIFLSVKQSELENVAVELDKVLRDDHIVISCLAMVDLVEVRYFFRRSDPTVVKVMTTLGVFNRCGISGYLLDSFASCAIQQTVRNVLGMISVNNRVYELKTEEQMQLFTVFISCMQGVIPHFANQFNWRILKEEPEAFAWYTESIPDQLRSIANLIEQSSSPSILWGKVATPGGITRAMTDALGKGGLSSLVSEAIESGLQHMKGTKK